MNKKLVSDKNICLPTIVSLYECVCSTVDLKVLTLLYMKTHTHSIYIYICIKCICIVCLCIIYTHIVRIMKHMGHQHRAAIFAASHSNSLLPAGAEVTEVQGHLQILMWVLGWSQALPGLHAYTASALNCS